MGPVYTLNNGAKGVEENRLDTQHNLFRVVTGGLLPDHVREHLESKGSSVSIADFATGTGIWLKDLAPTLPPTAKLDGFDFDPSKFPEQSTLPPNVSLQFGDVLQPVAPELHGRYDLVHVRLLLYALKVDQWQSVASNLSKLLAPGGWLFWDELSFTSWQCLPMTKNFLDWISAETRYALSVDRDPNAGINLLRYIKNAGYVNCTQQAFSTYAGDADVRRTAGILLLAAGSQSMHGIVEKGGFDYVKTHEDASRIVDAVVSDIESGLCEVGFEHYWVMAQKA